MGRRHKWKVIKGLPVKGEIEHKKCMQCGSEVRTLRKGRTTTASSGWVETWYRESGCSLWDYVDRNFLKMPECEGSAGICPTCGGTIRKRD